MNNHFSNRMFFRFIRNLKDKAILVFLCIALLFTFVAIFPKEAFAITPEQFRKTRLETKIENMQGLLVDPELKDYLKCLWDDSYDIIGTGTLSDRITNANVHVSYGDTCGLWKKFCVDLGFTEWCSPSYGFEFGYNIDAQGPIEYKYDIPFTVKIVFPSMVFPGQHIYFEPRFDWILSPAPGTDARVRMEAKQNYNTSTTLSSRFDVPDGLDETKVIYSQYATYANIYIKLPVFPGVPSIPIDSGDINNGPFGQGGSDFHGGYAWLGSSGSINNEGYWSWLHPSGVVHEFGEYDANSVPLIGLNAGMRTPFPMPWRIGTEHLELAAWILQQIPNVWTQAIGTCIDVIRNVGGFKLNTDMTGEIFRQDGIRIVVAERPSLKVPDDLTFGSTWNFTNIPVKVKYKVLCSSTFHFPIAFKIIFDMYLIDPKVIWDYPVTWFGGGHVITGVIEKEGEFYISGTAKVTSLPLYLTFCPGNKDPYQPLFSNKISYPYPDINVSFNLPSNVKLATKKDKMKIIQETENIKLPKPTNETALPAQGHYTVIVGVASQNNATRIVNALNQKGIRSFVTRVTGIQGRVITLGSFQNQEDARTLAFWIKEIFKIEVVFTNRVEVNNCRQLSNEDILRITR